MACAMASFFFYTVYSYIVLVRVGYRGMLQECNCQSCHHDRDHRHQFDEDVERRTRRILERIAHSVAYHGGLVSPGLRSMLTDTNQMQDNVLSSVTDDLNTVLYLPHR